MDLFDKNVHGDEFRLRILLTNGCNRNCSFCLNDFQKKPKRPAFLHHDDAFRAVATYCHFMQIEGKKPVVTFSGGEPGIHPDIHAILATAKKAGAFVKVVTNGTALHLTQLKPFVDCWHVSITDVNTPGIAEFLDLHKGYNVQIQKVVTENVTRTQMYDIVDYWGPRGVTVKFWADFFASGQSKNKIEENIKAVADKYSIYKIISRFSGKQENRGPACRGCEAKCVTLKALWVFPDGTTSTCPQGLRERSRPQSWQFTIEEAYKSHSLQGVCNAN
jgi:molybdenum cofactor biosynthesis enzyme MoaA